MGTWKRDVTGGWASPSGAKAARRGARSGALLGAGAVLVMLAGCSSGPGASDAPTRGDTATWELRGDVSADSRTLEIGVTRLGCADGVTGAVLEPQVTYEEDRTPARIRWSNSSAPAELAEMWRHHLSLAPARRMVGTERTCKHIADNAHYVILRCGSGCAASRPTPHAASCTHAPDLHSMKQLCTRQA